jgi:hypothetical protein
MNFWERWANRGRSLIFLTAATLVLWGLAGLVIRLHLTQRAYEFEVLKKYHRSLKEEEIRLRAKVAEELSLSQIKSDVYREPTPDQVVRMP